VVDHRRIVSVNVFNDDGNFMDNGVGNLVDNSLVMDGGVVDDGLVMDGDFVMSVGNNVVRVRVVVEIVVLGGITVWKVSIGMMDNLLIDVSLSLVRSFGGTVLLGVMRIFSDGCLVTNDLVVMREFTGVAIVVVHLEVEGTILNVDLAGHKEGRVVLESPVVASVPLLGIPGVEVVSPSELEVLGVLVVVVNFNEIVLGVPRHLSVIEIVVPWRPHGSPEVHHELGRHVKEVHIFLAFALANKFVVNVPADVVGSPLDGVGEPVSARVEAGGVVMVLSTVFPDDIHGVWVLSHGWDDLNIDLVPAMGPVLSSISEEGLNGTHLSGVLHLDDELSVSEPFLGANLTREIIGLSDSSESNNSGS